MVLSSAKSSVLVLLVYFTVEWLSPSKRPVGRTVRPGNTPCTTLENIWVALRVSFAQAMLEHCCAGYLERLGFESGLK